MKARHSMHDPFVPSFKRRTFLRAGFAAAGAMGLVAWKQQAIAQSEGLAPARFLFLYTPSGREPSWRTDTPGPSYTLGPTMQMFEPYKSKLSIIDGLTVVKFDYGNFNSHFAGSVCMLGGKEPQRIGTQANEGVPASVQRTFDHLMGDRIGTETPVRNIVVGGLDTDNEAGVQSISWSAPMQVETPIHDPARAFAALFAGGAPTPLPTDPAQTEALRLRQEWEKEILGLTQLNTASFKSRLGSQEAQQLQAYEANLANTLQQLQSNPTNPVALPAACSSLNYDNLMAGLSTDDFQRHHDLQSRILAAGLACGRTRVAAYSMAGINGSMTVPGTERQHHFHDDDAVEHYKAFDLYYGDRIKFLLDELASYPEGDGSVLDHTIIVWSTEIGWTPSEHDHERHPVYLLGGLPNKKLRMGEYIKLPYVGANREDGLNNPNNRRLHELLLTIAEQMGVTDLADFADPAFVQGPLSEVLV